MSIAAAYRSPRRQFGRVVAGKIKLLIWGDGYVKGDKNSDVLDRRFLSYGCSVAKLDKAGGGIPDRLIGMGRRDQLVEYKNPDGDKNHKKLRASQQDFFDRWIGRIPEIARTTEDVDRIVEKMRET